MNFNIFKKISAKASYIVANILVKIKHELSLPKLPLKNNPNFFVLKKTHLHAEKWFVNTKTINMKIVQKWSQYVKSCWGWLWCYQKSKCYLYLFYWYLSRLIQKILIYSSILFIQASSCCQSVRLPPKLAWY